MENTPKITPAEEAPETKESKKTKKKKAESLGAFAVEPKHSETKSADKEAKSSFWDRPDEPTKTADNKPETDQLTSPEHDETDPPLEHLSESEKQYAVEAIVESAEAADVTPKTEEEAVAAEAVAQFRHELIENGADVEAAAEAVFEGLGVEAGEYRNKDLELPDDALDEESSHAETEEEQTPAEIVVADEEQSKEPDMAVEGGGNGGGSPQPPIRPIGGGFPPHGPGAVPFGPVLRPNAAPPTPAEQIIDQGNTAGAALVGGIVGYLIGRRRGRIKTEKRLLPIQKKLQNEITDLQWQIQDTEAKIRKAAVAQARSGRLPTPAQRLEQRAITPKTPKEQPAPEWLRNVAATHEVPKSVEARKVAPEAQKIHSLPEKTPSHLGHIVVTAEAAPKRPAAPEHTFVPKAATIEKQFETINRAELMRLSEKIIVDGSSLRQIYESRLVGEKGLRRLVREHFRGGDLKKALRREIVEREIDFERDPILRDHAASSQASPNGGGPTNAIGLQHMLKQANVDLTNEKEETAFLKARAEHEQRVKKRELKKRKTMDISLITTIVVLFGLLLLVGIMHR